MYKFVLLIIIYYNNIFFNKNVDIIYMINKNIFDVLGEKKNPINDSEFSDEYKNISQYWSKLPIHKPDVQKNIINTLKKHQLILLTAETGSGKTTQVPKFILNHLKYKGKIVCTQPRKLAVSGTAERVAAELDVKLGQEVGYHFRLEKRANNNTKLIFMTDGILLIQIINDPKISEYDAIIIDEAHERSMNIDLLLLLLKNVLEKKLNPKLKIIIMSATADVKKFNNYFKKYNPGLISVSGKTFPIEQNFLKSNSDYLKTAIEKVVDIHKNENSGDILVFLPSKSDTEKGCKLLQKYQQTDLFCTPLYSGINKNIEELATHPDKYKNWNGNYNRKVVLSTPVAETSITINGVVYVIETGLVNESVYLPEIRANQLKKSNISKANVKQRIGRAGRTQPGVSYHMYSKSDYLSFEDFDMPEFTKSNISQNLLQLLKMLKSMNKIKDFFNKLIDPPTEEYVKSAEQDLINLKAINNDKLTPLGLAMSNFPTSPQISRMIIYSKLYGCENEILILGTMMTISNNLSEFFNKPNPFDEKQKKKIAKARNRFQKKSGDHYTLINIYKSFQDIDKSKDRAIKWCNNNEIKYGKMREIRMSLEKFTQILNDIDYSEKVTVFQKKEYNIMKSILSGFFMQVAYNNGYQMIIFKINESGNVRNVKSDFMVFGEYLIIDRPSLENVSPIPNPKFLLDVARHYFTGNDFPYEQQIILKKIKNKK
jgi:pre-mRNA-splicing factor ATP-dependent RNA helicase DHX15/PRP43